MEKRLLGKVTVKVERADGTFENYGVRDAELVGDVLTLRTHQPDADYYGKTVCVVPSPEQINQLRAIGQRHQERGR